MRPAPRSVLYLGIWALVGTMAFRPEWRLLWIGFGLALAVVLAVDARSLLRTPAVGLERETAGSLALGVWTPVRLRLASEAARPIRLHLFDHHPAVAEVEGLPREVLVAPGGALELSYRLRPRRRGDHAFEPAEMLVESPYGFWHRRRRAGERQPVRVLPNFRPVTRYALLALEDRLGQMGIRIAPRRGAGLEFQELREYRRGDTRRQIDWKATSRRQKLISRQYQEEKDQRILLLLDRGRRMRSRDGDVSHFDQALNALLLLTYVAQRQGDAIGLLTFGGPEIQLPPQKGAGALAAVLEAVYALETTTEPPDYLAAAARATAVQKRRALIVLLSNLRDEDSSELLPALELLRRRHLVLFASLREEVLERAASTLAGDLPEALLAGASHHYLAAREKAHRDLRGRGILTLDVEPEQFAVRLVNEYLDIKRGGLL